MRNILFIFITILFIFSCEEKAVEIPIFIPPSGNKHVLVEDLTGVRCSNCPTGRTKLESLEELYGEKLIVVGIHGEQLTHPVEDHDYNLSNDYAVDVENYLKPFLGKPAISSDRNAYIPTKFAMTGIEQWPSFISKAFEEEFIMEILISSTWDESTRKINLNVDYFPLENDLNSTYKISVMLVESEIETAQKSPTGTIPDYIHHDVLRTMMTSAVGDEIDVSKTKNQINNLSYSHTLPSEDGTWRADHMDIVVFITDAVSKVVLQTKKIAVIQ